MSGLASTLGWPLSGRRKSPELFYAFTSFLAPSTVYRYDVANGAGSPFRPARLPFDPAAYETRQVFFPSKDGTRVPMFLTAAKSLQDSATWGARLPVPQRSAVPSTSSTGSS